MGGNVMKLQIALDIADTNDLLEIADNIHDVIDIIEVGTPVVKDEGLQAVSKLKEKYPDLKVFADMKTADAGTVEAQDVVKHNGDLMSVLAISDDSTISDMVEVAHENGAEVIADLITIKDIEKRGKELVDLGVDYVAVHTGLDAQAQGQTPLDDLRKLVKAIPAENIAVAGGVNMDNIKDYVAENPAIIIAGGALYNADDIRQAVIDMKAELK